MLLARVDGVKLSSETEDYIAPVEINEPLPFSAKKQMALLGYLLCNGNFFSQVWNKIKEGWFTDPHVSIIWRARLAFQKQYGRLPITLSEFEESAITFAPLDNAELIRCR